MNNLKKAFLFIVTTVSACSLEIITTEGLNKILEKSNSNNSKTWFTSVFLSHKYSLISIILSVILTAICTILIQKLFKKTKSNYEKKANKFIKNCNKTVDLGNGIYINYDVYISDFDGQPTPYNLIIKCNKKNINTILEYNNSCLISHSCDNQCIFKNYTNSEVKNYYKQLIQSELINEWNNFNK